MIELYGSPMSSAGRTRWMLEEVGVSYEYRRVDTRAGQTRTPEYLRMYGGGTVPVLRDGDLVLGESMAINFYLAEKYGPDLLPNLDQSLTGRDYLVASRFTVADCNTGSIANIARATGLLESLPNARAWMERLAARPAYQRAAKD